MAHTGVLVLRIVFRVHLGWDDPAVNVFMYVLGADDHRACARRHVVRVMWCPIFALREARLHGDASYQGALNMQDLQLFQHSNHFDD